MKIFNKFVFDIEIFLLLFYEDINFKSKTKNVAFCNTGKNSWKKNRNFVWQFSIGKKGYFVRLYEK